MKKRWKSVVAICFALVVVVGIMHTMNQVHAAGTFADKEAVIVWIGDHPSQMADLLENNLSQALITQFEGLTITVATDDAELNLLQRALVILKREGVSTASVIDALEDRIAVLETL